MSKTILLTGATDGIGKVTAHMLAEHGHTLLLHGRNKDKLDKIVNELGAIHKDIQIESYLADLSLMNDALSLAESVGKNHENIDIIINNAGIFKTPNTITKDGFDIRFAVNTFAPYIITQKLLPKVAKGGRVVNVSSAAQAPVDMEILRGIKPTSDNAAYAQSKLAITMWTAALAQDHSESETVFVSVNPASLLGSKMVNEAYGIAGGDISIGAEILTRASLDESFAKANGLYFDNDQKRFSDPHPDAMDKNKTIALKETLETLLEHWL